MTVDGNPVMSDFGACLSSHISAVDALTLIKTSIAG